MIANMIAIIFSNHTEMIFNDEKSKRASGVTHKKTYLKKKFQGKNTICIAYCVDPTAMHTLPIALFCDYQFLKDHLRMIGKNDSDNISYHFYTVFPIALLVTSRCRCIKCAFCAIRNERWSLNSLHDRAAFHTYTKYVGRKMSNL